MTDQIVRLGPEYFPRPTSGVPVAGGSIYIGDPDTDPEIPGNQITVNALQENGSTVPISQPILTSGGGVPLYNGSTVTLLVSESYSLKVLDAFDVQVYYVPSIIVDVASVATTVDYITDLIGLIDVSSPTDNQTHVVLSFFDGLNKGGGNFYWDSTIDKATANGGAIIDPDNTGGFDGTVSTLSAFLTAQSGGVGFGCWVRLSDEWPIAFWWGAIGDGITDDRDAIQVAIEYVGGTLEGGVLDFGGLTYCIDSSEGVHVNHDNVLITNFIFKRTVDANTGFTVRFASTVDTTGGGVTNGKFVGIHTVAAMAGLTMGTTVYKANNYVIDNVEATLHGQYGVAIEAGDNWKISNILITEHGLTVGSISSCMGFYVYPKIASEGGQLNNISSQISDDCIANVSANTAAVKLQTHSKLTANNITAKYGSEEAMVIDSVSGVISDVLVYQQGIRVGLSVGNYSDAHSFSGNVFTLDGFKVVPSTIANNASFSIAGTDGHFKLDGCTVRNGFAGGAGFLTYAATRNCIFENISFSSVKFSTEYRGFGVNVLSSSSNTFNNVTVRGGIDIGVLVLETSDSTITNCGGSAYAGETLNALIIYGSSNQIIDTHTGNSDADAIKIIGDLNELTGFNLKDITGSSLWLPSGSNGNIIRNAGNIASVGTGILDSGLVNIFHGQSPTTAADAGDAAKTIVWTSGDRTHVWDTPLTAPRVCTLPTTEVPEGGRLLVVRTAAATGGFNLVVGTGPIKVLATEGLWCEVEYNGSAWFLVSSGSL